MTLLAFCANLRHSSFFNRLPINSCPLPSLELSSSSAHDSPERPKYRCHFAPQVSQVRVSRPPEVKDGRNKLILSLPHNGQQRKYPRISDSYASLPVQSTNLNPYLVSTILATKYICELFKNLANLQLAKAVNPKSLF